MYLRPTYYTVHRYQLGIDRYLLSWGPLPGGQGGRPPPPQILGKIWIFLIFVMINLTFCRFRPPSPPPQILGSSGPHAYYTDVLSSTSFSEAYLIFVSIRVRQKMFHHYHQKNTNLVNFDLKEAIFLEFLNGI